jgi:hypothetical protein
MTNAKVKCVDSFGIEFLKYCIFILMVNKKFLIAILASNNSNSLGCFVSKGPKGRCGSLYCDYTLLSTQKMVWSQLYYSIKFKECKILIMFLCKHNYDWKNQSIKWKQKFTLILTIFMYLYMKKISCKSRWLNHFRRNYVVSKIIV